MFMFQRRLRQIYLYCPHGILIYCWSYNILYCNKIFLRLCCFAKSISVDVLPRFPWSSMKQRKTVMRWQRLCIQEHLHGLWLTLINVQTQVTSLYKQKKKFNALRRYQKGYIYIENIQKCNFDWSKKCNEI